MMSSERHTLKNKRERPLMWALLLTFTFLLVELVGGLITGSLALISDAAHMVTDVTAMIIAIVAIKISQRPADELRTFGYFRFEILAAAFNTLLLFFVAIYILYEAYLRLSQPPVIHSNGMLIIAIVGLGVNLISMLLLAGDKDKNLNIKSAYLDVWSDMLGSVGVIIGALIINTTGWVWVDSIIAVLIGLWILPRTWVLLKESINILLEGVPAGIDLKKLKEVVLSVEGVLDIHELHVWAITSDRINLTAHIILDQMFEGPTILQNLRCILLAEFNISHTTFQTELEKCNESSNSCGFNSHN
ncbi:MAG: cation diffusion facilitator family transporter [Gammaproteobacteria bacterium]